MELEIYCNSKECSGYDYMSNAGQEEQDRDWVGIILAVAIMAFLTLTQYMKMY